MSLVAPLPKPAGARPPNFGGPPTLTTFSNDPEDNRDMVVSLRDNVNRLVGQARGADKGDAPMFLRLLNQRRDWIRNELDVESMFSEMPAAPLDIPIFRYDLSTLSIDPVDPRRKEYERMLREIDDIMSDLWERMLVSDEESPE